MNKRRVIKGLGIISMRIELYYFDATKEQPSSAAGKTEVQGGGLGVCALQQL